MRFTTALLTVALALTFSLPAKADVIAFSGDHCDGGEGKNVACDEGCIGFGGRHSVRVLASGTHCLTFFQNSGCSINVGTLENGGGGACSNVNTGTAVNSFRCSPNSVCASIATIPDGNVTVPEVAGLPEVSGST